MSQSQEDRLADIRQAVDEATADPEEQRQLLAVADELTRHYGGRRRGGWVFTAGAVAAAVGIMAVGAYTVLGRIHGPVPSQKALGSGVAVVTSQVPYVTVTAVGKLAAAYRPQGMSPLAEVVLMKDKLANGDTAILVWNPASATTAPVEEVVVPTASAVFTSPGALFGGESVATRNLFLLKTLAQGGAGASRSGTKAWSAPESWVAQGQAPPLSLVLLPSGSFPGLPLIPIHYAPGVPELSGGRLVLVQVAGISPAYWLINTDGQVVAAGSNLAEPLSSYGPVQHGLAALEQLLGF
jgi:hypothetical protein